MNENMPWKDEVDSWDGEESGLACRIRRIPGSGHLCGYVGVPEEHPLFGRDYSNCPNNIEVHGGLTFSGEMEDSSLHFFGFDCAHSGDLCPYRCERGDLIFRGDTYKNFDYVMREVKQLALRLSQEKQPEKAQQAFEKWFPTFDGWSNYDAAKQSWNAALEWIKTQ